MLMLEVVMLYREFVEAVSRFSFVRDEKTAGEMVRAVVELVESRLSEVPARNLAALLPDPLNEKEADRDNPNMWSLQEAIGILAMRFNLGREQASHVFNAVAHTAKE